MADSVHHAAPPIESSRPVQAAETAAKAVRAESSSPNPDAKLSIMDFDYIQLDFKPQRLVLGLTSVSLVKVTSGENDYKIIENMGGNDVTAVYASLISAGVSTVLTGNPTAATYNEEANTITITSTGDAGIKLKSPKELYENGIKGIEQL